MIVGERLPRLAVLISVLEENLCPQGREEAWVSAHTLFTLKLATPLINRRNLEC
jgi:hypothetical protein